MHDMLSPRVHWGQIAYAIARYKYHWYEVPPVLIVDTELLEITRSWRISYSGSYGSPGTQSTRNGYMYRMMKYGGPGAQWGHIAHWTVRSTWHCFKWLPGLTGTKNVWKWIDFDVVHIVAPMAHRRPGTSEIAKCKGCWSPVAPGAQWGHIVHRTAICIWHWYEVAPRAHWGHETSENG